MNEDKKIIESKTKVKEPPPQVIAPPDDSLDVFLSGFSSGLPAVIEKKRRGRPKKFAELQEYSEESLLDNAEELTQNMYTALNTMLRDMITSPKPNPKFITIAMEALRVLEEKPTISINTTTISNSGNTQNNIHNTVGGSFEQIAALYHERERRMQNDEFRQKFIDDGKSDKIIDAEIIDEPPAK